MKVTIPRDRWLRGDAAGILWNVDTGCGCVFGHYAIALGYDPLELHLGDEPSGVPVPTNAPGPLWPDWVVYDSGLTFGPDDEPAYVTTAACGHMISINDTPGLTDETREKQLKMFFGYHGVELEFV